MRDQDYGIGDSRQAERTLVKEFPTQRAGEQVLLPEPQRRPRPRPAPRRGDDLTARLERVARDRRDQVAARPRRTPGSSPGRALGAADLPAHGRPGHGADRVAPALAATAAVQRAHPQLRVGEFGDGSANKAINDRFAADFRRAEFTSVPVTLAILVVAFGALAAAGIPLLLGMTAVAGGARPDGADQPRACASTSRSTR